MLFPLQPEFLWGEYRHLEPNRGMTGQPCGWDGEEVGGLGAGSTHNARTVHIWQGQASEPWDVPAYTLSWEEALAT